ncbi:MAG: exopolysaccharide biosynthesis polyprenyl glycosylphosphotransferase [Lachnospiraceae bacterium]|nr:exopolysaccharide biosynthesis polyprenyl glycosylphosphotransferase [Lachnospiraceae bacterium]
MNTHQENVKRSVVLLLSFVDLIILSAIYAGFWFAEFYPTLRMRRMSVNGVIYFTEGLKFYLRGHLLILLIYFALLWFFLGTYGGLRIGYLKAPDLFFSQIFAITIVNVLTYLYSSLMRNWIMPGWPYLFMTILQLSATLLWTLLASAVYRRAFPPRRLLLVHGVHSVEEIRRKFLSRRDKYTIARLVDISLGVPAVERLYEEGSYDAIVIWDVPTTQRNELLKYCYGKNIRIYTSPKISDVLIKGSEQLHLFDTPIFLIREQSIRAEQLAMKRLSDILLALVLIVVTSPIMLVTALLVHFTDGGPVLYRQVRCTQGMRRFQILKFRSMRIDAEKDGVARLATRHDDRITPVGRFIRSVRIDELPQLFNILKGEMSFIGPRPERPEIIEEYLKTMPEFIFRTHVKAGLAGYAQVYGKYNTTPYDKLKLDLTYIENYSIWLDLKLMLLTLKILFTPDATEGVEQGQITAEVKDAEKKG